MFFFLLACVIYPEDNDSTAHEGDDPYECIDGADNDRDGLFDCSDDGCAASPDCADADADTDTDADADTDTDADTDADTDTYASRYTSMTVSYTLTWDFDDFWSFYGLEDCVQSYSGQGSAHSAGPGWETSVGSWEKLSDDCNAKLSGTVWVGDGTGHHTLHLAGSTMTAWVVHADAGDTAPEGEAEERFSVYDISVDLSSGEGEHTESEDVYDSGIFLATLTSALVVTVSD